MVATNSPASEGKWKFGAALKAEGHPSDVMWAPDATRAGHRPGRSIRVRRGLAWSEAHVERWGVERARAMVERDGDVGVDGFADHGS